MASSGNFATWNPLANTASGLTYSGSVYSEGNTRFRGNTGGTATTQLTHGLSSGKWYIEFFVDGSPASGFPMIGIVANGVNSNTLQNTSNAPALTITSDIQLVSGEKRVFGSTSNTSYGSGFSDTDICQIAVDIDNGKIWWGKNNTWFASGDPAAGSNAGDTFTGGTEMMLFVGSYSGASYMICNAGQDDTFAGNVTAEGNADGNGFGVFKYAPPTGFLSLASSNLFVSSDIDPAGDDGETENPDKQAGAVLYTGNGGSPDLVVSGLGFKPDLVWGKARSASQLPILQDSARGQELLFSSSANAAQTSNGPFMASYDADGFTFDGSGSNPNDNAVTYVAWCFRANGGTATATISESGNNPGAVVQANPKGGFSIITYTGTGGAGTIAHGLSTAPTFMIIKNRGVADNWAVYHTGTDSSPATKYLVLNSNAAAADDSTYWNDTAPTSSVLTVGTNHSVNADGENYVAYVWAPVEGGSKFGSFKGNADDDGPFIYTGFRPKIIFIKENDNADDWVVYDTARSTFNPVQKVVRWENAAAEFDGSGRAIDILSNGFKIRTSNNTINQASTFVYGAWGDVPFKYNNTF